MKVKVNKDACIGCGACQYTSDHYFTIGDDGFAEVVSEYEGKDVPEEFEEKVQDAVDSCPTDAIEKLED